MTVVDSIDPRTGRAVEDVAPITTAEQVAELAAAAAQAHPAFIELGREFRAELLRAIATELESERERIVEIGTRETGLPDARLHGELTRTVYQANLFADVVDEGSYLEATIDHAGETPMGPGPDIRRLLVPLGPVAVFGASNFPLAFSVPGGDTISALAAGCPVIVKAHSSHPALSQFTYEVIDRAARSVGAPSGLFGLVFGVSAGAALVADPRITAVGFTGSLAGGQALIDIIGRRREPIPFYGELSSLNPLVVTEGAATARGADIAAGLIASVTGSAGQLCTKPGLAFVPKGPAGDALVAEAAELVEQVAAQVLLNERISDSYNEISGRIEQRDGVTVVAEGGRPGVEGFAVTPRLLQVDADLLGDEEIEECFGPTAVIARYETDRLHAALETLPSSLTGTIHAEADETDLVVELSAVLQPRAGRLVYNGYPTGVLVSWAQNHGGPWPSTNTVHTSVGVTSIRRWLRPVAWQSAPENVLPAELRDDYTSIVRRVDGRIVLP